MVSNPLARIERVAADRFPVAYACVKMSRPSQLALIALVYLLGVVIAVAWGTTLDVLASIAGLAVLLPVAASVHYANEYADYETDALTDRTPFSGGSGALHETGLSRPLALRAAIASLAIGVGGALLCLLHGVTLPALLVLAVIAVLGWMYSLPPLELVWRGFGELDNAALGGLILPLYGFAMQTGRLSGELLLACVPFTILLLVNLLETHWPDREADAAVGKVTLATRWAPRRLRIAYVGGILAYLVSLAVLDGPVLPRQVVLASLAVVPLLLWGAVRYTRRETPLPGVLAMVLLAAIQVVAWARLGGLV
jgi:1,4-dihydroxy-2-naphthoate octaprenyltransferase